MLPRAQSLGFVPHPSTLPRALIVPLLMQVQKFDDFVVTHIQQTLDIHYSGIFPPWHRWFVYQYEKALREECGYKGYQPVS